MDITDPAIEDYIRGLLARHDEPVLLEMEADAKEKGFPIVGRMVGVVLEILARSIGAKRVFEGFEEEDSRPQWTAAIQEMNQAVASDPDYLSTILPIRDGDTVALRLR